MSGSTLHFEVCTGIGDISWVYSKLITLKRPLHFHVAKDCPWERARPFLEILPYVEKVTYDGASTRTILKTGHRPDDHMFSLIEEAARGPVPLHMNTHLEDGHRIEEYIPQIGIEHHYPIKIPAEDQRLATAKLGTWRRYVTLYCANTHTAKSFKGWRAAQWCEMASKLVREFDLDGVVIIGANWDRPMANLILKQLKVPVKSLIGQLTPAGSLEVIKRGIYMVAFPSGMPILASVMQCPVMMFYPALLGRMPYAWPDPALVESGAYKGWLFCEPTVAFEWIRDVYRLGERSRADGISA